MCVMFTVCMRILHVCACSHCIGVRVGVRVGVSHSHADSDVNCNADCLTDHHCQPVNVDTDVLRLCFPSSAGRLHARSGRSEPGADFRADRSGQPSNDSLLRGPPWLRALQLECKHLLHERCLCALLVAAHGYNTIQCGLDEFNRCRALQHVLHESCQCCRLLS